MQFFNELISENGRWKELTGHVFYVSLIELLALFIDYRLFISWKRDVLQMYVSLSTGNLR